MEGFKTKKTPKYIKYSSPVIKSCYAYVSRDTEMISIDGYWLVKKAIIDIEPIMPIIPFCGFIFTDLVNEYSLFCSNSKTIAHNSKILRVLLATGYTNPEFYYVVNDTNKPKIEAGQFVDATSQDTLSWVKPLLTGSDLMDRRTEIFNEETLSYRTEIFQDVDGYKATNERLTDKGVLSNEEASEEVCLKLYTHSHSLLHLGEIPDNLKKYIIDTSASEKTIDESSTEETNVSEEVEESEVEEVVAEPTIEEVIEPVEEVVGSFVEEVTGPVEDIAEEVIEESVEDSVKASEELVEEAPVEDTQEEQVSEEADEDVIEQLDINTVEQQSEDTEEPISDGPEVVVDNIDNFTEPEFVESEEDITEESATEETVVEEPIQEEPENIENLTEEIPEPVVDTTEEVSLTIEPVIEERPVRQRKDYSTHPIYREMDELPVIQELHNLYKLIAPQKSYSLIGGCHVRGRKCNNASWYYCNLSSSTRCNSIKPHGYE